MSTITELTWVSLTAAINRMKSPRRFVRDLVFGRSETLTTEKIELSTVSRGRQTAPFVRKNGEAVMIPGYDKTFATVEAPNIRIKRPMTPSEILFDRQPGTPIFPTGEDQQVSAIQQHIARDMEGLDTDIVNSEEYLACMALRGQITYEVTDQGVFQITFPRPGGHTLSLSPGSWWDDADVQNVKVWEDARTAKKLVNDEEQLSVTHAICGDEAAYYLRRFLVASRLMGEAQRISAGQADFNAQFDNSGAMFIGRIFGIDWWEYPVTLSVDGTSTNLIRPKYVEFVSARPEAESLMYYGAIGDLDAYEGRTFVARRFSKSWIEKDPSVRWLLAHSRPFPMLRKPGSTVSMKVVSG